MSSGMKASDNVFWEPAKFANRHHTKVCLCIDGRILDYDDKYMREAGAWFHEGRTGECFPVFRQETDMVFKEFGSVVTYANQINRVAEQARKIKEKQVADKLQADAEAARVAQVQAERAERIRKLTALVHVNTDPVIATQYLLQCLDNDWTKFRGALLPEDLAIIARGLLGRGKDAARILTKAYVEDTEFLEETMNNINETKSRSVQWICKGLVNIVYDYIIYECDIFICLLIYLIHKIIKYICFVY